MLMLADEFLFFGSRVKNMLNFLNIESNMRCSTVDDVAVGGCSRTKKGEK